MSKLLSYSRSMTIGIALVLAALAFGMVGCGDNSEPADLTGDWQSTGDSRAQVAQIKDDTIVVAWYNGGDNLALYWVGSYTPPTKGGNYSWTSVRDTSKKGLLASNDEDKTFNYDAGSDTISYQVTALGVESTVTLKRMGSEK